MSLQEATERIEKCRHENATYLNLRSLQLERVPPEVFELSLLTRLDVQDNQVSSLPPEIGALANLRELYLYGNQLSSLPSEIGALAHLQELFLNGNQLSSLPSEIGALAHLQELFLNGNQLSSLPSEIGALANLQKLYLQGNQLSSLPSEIENLSRLTQLFLHENPDLGLPEEILGPTYLDVALQSRDPAPPAAIVEYYFRTRQGARPLNEAKLILVGRGGAGKTTLVHRLKTGKFLQPNKTKGIRVDRWKIDVASDKVQLNVWDFGGQEIMHSTHRCFLTERSLYLIVLSGREGNEDEDAEYWLNMVRSFGGDSPVILVLNKQHEHPFDLNRGGLLEKYSSIKAIVRTDCEDGLGVEDLVEHIQAETDKLEGLRAKFPDQWFRIKDRLTKMKENYLSETEFGKICGDLGEKEADAQESLAGYLNDLGIALCYKEMRLRSMHVLNPHWMVDGIYRVINSDKLAEQGGVLSEAEIDAALSEKNYPPHTHQYLVDLMRKFELCFALTKSGHYLVPDLLPKEQPAEATAFLPEQCLNFQYDYGSAPIPEGLLPRFIVRSHRLIQGKLHWRSGVILEFDGATALVRADRGDKKAYITIKGPEPARLRLLTVIRSDFDAIHADFRGLAPEELVPLPLHPDVTVPYQDLTVAEEDGFDEIPVRVGRRMEMVNVRTLRTSVDGTERGKEPPRVFVSYAHKDEKYREELGEHLALLEKQNLIRVWHDRQIEPGKPWPHEIRRNLEESQIVLVLVSASSIASEWCWEKELPLAMELREQERAEVIPIVVRKVNWDSSELAGLQALPKDGKPVSLHGDQDSAWTEVSERIEGVARRLLDSMPQQRGVGV